MRLVLVPKVILDRIRLLRRDHLPVETGGFLVGLRRGEHIEITGLTEQGREDVATATSFERRDPRHRRIIVQRWRDSDARETIVGDWHSHPVGIADRSSIDLGAWRTLARSTAHPIVGIIEAGLALPSVYLAADGQRPFDLALSLHEESATDLAFAVPH